MCKLLACSGKSKVGNGEIDIAVRCCTACNARYSSKVLMASTKKIYVRFTLGQKVTICKMAREKSHSRQALREMATRAFDLPRPISERDLHNILKSNKHAPQGPREQTTSTRSCRPRGRAGLDHYGQLAGLSSQAQLGRALLHLSGGEVPWLLQRLGVPLSKAPCHPLSPRTRTDSFSEAN